MDKWLMMYLETHPKYQGQDVGQEVFREWKRLLLNTCEVRLVHCCIIKVKCIFLLLKYAYGITQIVDCIAMCELSHLSDVFVPRND